MLFDIAGYYSAMDRESEKSNRPLSDIPIKDIGISTHPMKNQLDQLKVRIFQGASSIEMGFGGRGKGSEQNTTPEMYSLEEREAIRDLARINKVKLSTHASFNIGHLSGLGQQGFDDNQREMSLREIERAIDFAADTAAGGAVVIHTGEFPRSLSENFGHEGFALHPNEHEQATMYLVDQETGQIIQSIKKDHKVVTPVLEGENQGKVEWDKDESGKVRWFKPKYKEKEDGSGYEFKERGWDYFENLAKEHNKNVRNKEEEITAAQAYYRSTLEPRRQSAEGWAGEYMVRYKDASRHREEIENRIDNIKKGSINLEEIDPNEAARIAQKIMKENKINDPSQISESEIAKRWVEEEKNKLPKYDESLKSLKQQEAAYREYAVSQQQQAKEYERMVDRIKPIEEYGIAKTANTIARAAEFAHKKSEMLKDRGQLNSPIYVAPENIFPEQYGAHPDELKTIIQRSRKEYVDQYKGQYGEDKAKKLAEEHIRATFDIGHAYTWRKYFDDSKYNDPKKAEEAFQKWLMDKVDDLNKNKIIGHIHVSDNFGWEDEHVTPGQGRVPIKPFLDKMKKAGITEITVEPAAQDYRAMLGAWSDVGAPVYGGTSTRWTDVQFSYFGKTRSPYFVFGEYSPSQEYTLWSQVPLE